MKYKIVYIEERMKEIVKHSYPEYDFKHVIIISDDIGKAWFGSDDGTEEQAIFDAITSFKLQRQTKKTK